VRGPNLGRWENWFVEWGRLGFDDWRQGNGPAGAVWWLAYAVSASVEKLLSSHLMVRSTRKRQFSKQLNSVGVGLEGWWNLRRREVRYRSAYRWVRGSGWENSRGFIIIWGAGIDYILYINCVCIIDDDLHALKFSGHDYILFELNEEMREPPAISASFRPSNEI